jgi:hypothetical protein
MRDLEYEKWLDLLESTLERLENMPPDEQLVMDATLRMERGSWRMMKELLGVDDGQ